jgi:Flp pilus assembly protein TadG
MQPTPADVVRIFPRDHARRCRGQALIEFAFVMPVTLLLLLGIIDFGRAYVASIALEGAAREGARLAIDSSQTDAAVLARTEQSAQPMVLTASNISLCTAAIVPPAYPPPCAGNRADGPA